MREETYRLTFTDASGETVCDYEDFTDDEIYVVDMLMRFINLNTPHSLGYEKVSE